MFPLHVCLLVVTWYLPSDATKVPIQKSQCFVSTLSLSIST